MKKNTNNFWKIGSGGGGGGGAFIGTGYYY